MDVIRAADLVAMPWKNGGGVTREVAVQPPGAGFDAFDWRLSMADITQDGPFSPLPGVDRVLILMQGGGLVLDGIAPQPMQAGDRADFPGEAAVTGRLTAGPVRDLNLMLRRGRMRAEVRAVTLEGRLALDLTGPQTLLVLREGPLDCGGLRAGRQDTLVLGAGLAVVEGSAELVVIGLIPPAA